MILEPDFARVSASRRAIHYGNDVVAPTTISGYGFAQFAAGPRDVNSDAYRDLVLADENAHPIALFLGSASGDKVPITSVALVRKDQL